MKAAVSPARLLARAAALFLLAVLVPAQPAWARAPMLTVAVIPGDQDTLAMVAAVKALKAERALAGVSFRILPQSLLNDDDLRALGAADVVLARHMTGEFSKRLVPAMQALAARGGKVYGIGQNEGADRRLGLVEDPALRAYADAGGADNLADMIRLVLRRDRGFAVREAAPRELPQAALWEPRSGKLFEGFEDYAASHLAGHPERAGRPWVGLVVNRGQAIAGGGESLRAIAGALEARGLNVLAAYGFPSQTVVERFLLDASGRARVAAVVAVGMKLGNVPDKIGPVLERLEAPLVNAITLYRLTRREWELSPVGLDLAERSWQVAGPELAGMVAPTVVASKERRRDAATGLEYVAEVPIPERVARLAGRVRKLVDLRVTPPAAKRVAILYYNSPPGRENVGASYLNVLPRSLWQILTRLEAEGYDTEGRPASEAALFERLHEHGVNIGSWSPGALARLVADGHAVLLPVAEYRRWFDAQPAQLRAAMLKSWGEPEDFKVMVWRDPRGRPHFVFPAQRFGKLLFAPQPARGWGEDIRKMYHDTHLPPHHHYLAFYLWLQKGFKAHAMVHVGTHGTHEWLPGKEVGFTAADPPEAMVGDVPQVYPYSVDVVGEGLQAKRRGMAALVSHLTPPFDQAGLNPDLVTLHGLLDDHEVAMQKSESAAAAILAEINRLAGKMGVLKDIGKTRLETAGEVSDLHEYLHEVEQTDTPFGLHTFGLPASEELRQATAAAMVSRMPNLAPAERGERVAALTALLEKSAKAELDALVAALAGRHVAAGSGGDPLRNPASLPTGRNLYGFDPARIPPPGVYEQGARLAAALVEDYRKRHGRYPDRLMFSLWSSETMRHEGVLESEILALLGVRPKWDRWGRVEGVEVIPRAELGRPRVDVTLTPSGLYRDSLPNLMQWLDAAVSAVKDLPEADNPVRANVARTRAALAARGIAPDEAERMAAVRLFSEPPGSYGTGLDNVVRAGNTWSREEEVAEVYMNRVGHLFGQGWWGERPQGAEVAREVFRLALQDVKAVLHARSSNVYGVLDNDDVYQYLGGAAMAVRQVNGATPETLMVNLADPARARHETLDQFMGREMRSRYLNPAWINAMLKEGYAGARLVMQVADNLWGWQVTVPEAVDGAKWQEMFEVYVADKHHLDIRRQFREAKNLLAFQAMVDRMLVAVNKGYWQAAPEVVAKLEAMNAELIAEAGVACNADTCSSDEVARLARELDRQLLRGAEAGFGLAAGRGADTASPTQAARAANPAPAPATPPSPAAATEPAPAEGLVRGQEMREVARQRQVEQLLWAYAWLIAAIVVMGVGYQAWRTRRERARDGSTLSEANP